MAHFRHSQGKRRRSGSRLRGCRMDSGETLRCANPCKIGESQQYERNVPVPADVATHFVVVHAEIFAVFKNFLNMPSGANGLDHFWQGGSLWGKDKVVRLLRWIVYTATNEQPMSSIILPLVEHRNDGPVEEPGAFGTFAHGQSLPIPIVNDDRFDQRSLFASPSGRRLESDRFIASHSHHVRIPMRLQPGTQVQIATVDRISHDPANGDLSLENPLDHLLSQFWLCLQARLIVRDACGSTPIPLPQPGQGQVRFA